MPRFFFDLVDGGTVVRDSTGMPIGDVASVRDHALSMLPDLAAGLRPGETSRTVVSTARTEKGKPIFKAILSLSTAWLE